MEKTMEDLLSGDRHSRTADFTHSFQLCSSSAVSSCVPS